MSVITCVRCMRKITCEVYLLQVGVLVCWCVGVLLVFWCCGGCGGWLWWVVVVGGCGGWLWWVWWWWVVGGGGYGEDKLSSVCLSVQAQTE